MFFFLSVFLFMFRQISIHEKKCIELTEILMENNDSQNFRIPINSTEHFSLCMNQILQKNLFFTAKEILLLFPKL